MRRPDLEQLLDEWLAVIEHALESCRYELTTGMGKKRQSISRDDVTKIRELSTAMRAAGDLKVQLAKAAKLLADSMTPEEVLAASVKRVMAVEPQERTPILQEMIRQHREEVLASSGHRSRLGDTTNAIDYITEALANPGGDPG